jgi:acetyl esterase/lipase
MRGTVSAKLIPFLTQVNEAIALAKQQNVTFDPVTVRHNLNNLVTLISAGPQLAQVFGQTLEIKDQQIPTRIYVANEKTNAPVVIHFHGGGHMCGSIELYDDISRKIAFYGECIVIAVDYRLAPEYPYPLGLLDCELVVKNYRQLLAGINHNEQLILIGDSAGGAICTTLASKSLSDNDLSVDKQILIYPSVDYTMRHDSIQENGQGFLLEADKIAWYFEQYLQHGEDKQQVSPLYQTMSSALPKTMIFTAGCDPLRDEGIAYTNALIDHGVEITHVHFPELVHAYMLLEKLVPEACERTYQLIGDFIKS